MFIAKNLENTNMSEGENYNLFLRPQARDKRARILARVFPQCMGVCVNHKWRHTEYILNLSFST